MIVVSTLEPYLMETGFPSPVRNTGAGVVSTLCILKKGVPFGGREGSVWLDIEVRIIPHSWSRNLFLRRMNYRTFLGHTHPQIPKSAVSTKRSCHSETYQKAGSNAAGHREEPDLQWTYRETPGLKVNLLLFSSMWWRHFLGRPYYDISLLGFSAR